MPYVGNTSSMFYLKDPKPSSKASHTESKKLEASLNYKDNEQQIQKEKQTSHTTPIEEQTEQTHDYLRAKIVANMYKHWKDASSQITDVLENNDQTMSTKELNQKLKNIQLQAAWLFMQHVLDQADLKNLRAISSWKTACFKSPSKSEYAMKLWGANLDKNRLQAELERLSKKLNTLEERHTTTVELNTQLLKEKGNSNTTKLLEVTQELADLNNKMELKEAKNYEELELVNMELDLANNELEKANIKLEENNTKLNEANTKLEETNTKLNKEVQKCKKQIVELSESAAEIQKVFDFHMPIQKPIRERAATLSHFIARKAQTSRALLSAWQVAKATQNGAAMSQIRHCHRAICSM